MPEVVTHGWSWPARLARAAAAAYEPVRCPGAGVTGAGRWTLGAGLFGVVLMAGSFGGTRSADRLRRLSRVSAPKLTLATKN